MADRSQPKNYFIDMDGVLMRGAAPIPGAADFVRRLVERGAKFLLLTNNSLYTPRDLRLRLERSGLEVPTESIYTSAIATAQFLHSQHPEGTAYVIGESGLTTALHEVGTRSRTRTRGTSWWARRLRTRSSASPGRYVWWSQAPALSRPTPM